MTASNQKHFLMYINYVKLLSVVILSALNLSLTAQSPALPRQTSVVVPDSCKPAVEPDTTFYPVLKNDPGQLSDSEIMPLFPGSDKAFDEFIIKNTVYPSTALNDSATGEVIVTFDIGKGGCPAYFEVLQGMRDDLKNESLRVVKLLPRFKPGKKLRDSPKGRYWTNSVTTYIVIFNYQLKPKPGKRGITILPPVQ